jgi:hypothetical protein
MGCGASCTASALIHPEPFPQFAAFEGRKQYVPWDDDIALGMGFNSITGTPLHGSALGKPLSVQPRKAGERPQHSVFVGRADEETTFSNMIGMSFASGLPVLLPM